MAGNLTLSLLTAQSGLLSNQSALDVTANNIANAQTEGYSRKIPNYQQRVVNGTGAGVEISKVQRVVDEGLLKTLRQELGAFKSLEVSNGYYQRIQDTFGAPGDNTSLSHATAQITAAIEALALSPEKIIEQSEVVTRAEELTIKLQDMSTTIQDLRLQADRDLAELASEANDLLETIDRTNTQIVQTQAVSGDVTSLQDERDVAVNRLSEIMDVHYFQRGDGGLTVFTSGGTTLVGNQPTTLAHSAVGYVAPGQTIEDGGFSAITVTTGGETSDITNELRGGEMQGLIDLRDSVLPDLQSQLDELAYQLQDTVNQIHNRGTTFPGLQTMSGSRVFANSATQTITFDGTSDTKIVLMDQNGDQTAQESMRTIMGGAGPFTIDAVATGIQGWLAGNGAATAAVSVDATTGKMNVQLNENSLYLGFRDENAAADGSTLNDASILFDANGDGASDETIEGFSNFFGLNDFFVDERGPAIKESDIVPSTFLTATASTLVFRESGAAAPGVSLAIAPGSSLESVAASINANITDVTATVVTEGSGSRIRISHDSDKAFSVTQTAGTLLTDIGLKESSVGLSQVLEVRSDIISSPALVARGAVQWDANLGVAGEYFMSTGDGSIALALSQRFAQTTNFDAAGDLGDVTLSFEEYGASILSRNSNKAATVERQYENKDTLVSNLETKANTISGVNLDEEMSNLILFERGYSASARVINVIQSMFDALEGIIR